MTNILTLLNLLEDLELSMRDFYRTVATHFETDHEELSKCFARMASEEQTHAEMVRFQKRLVQQNPGKFSPVSTDVSGFKDFLSQVHQATEQARDLTPEQSLDLALDFESFSGERIYSSAIIESCPDLAPLIGNLTKNDEAHCDYLRTVVQRQLKKS